MRGACSSFLLLLHNGVVMRMDELATLLPAGKCVCVLRCRLFVLSSPLLVCTRAVGVPGTRKQRVTNGSVCNCGPVIKAWFLDLEHEQRVGRCMYVFVCIAPPDYNP